MKKWILWTILTSMCVSIAVHAYSFVEYTGNSGICYKRNEYVCWEERKIKENPNYKNLTIFIDLNTKTLELIHLDDKEILKRYNIASGKEDTPSPIGSWKIIGKGSWGEGFGTRFMALNVPWGKYGIHGTNKPNSIGWASSHGCIRMKNKDIEELYKIVKVGTPVIIWGGPYGAFGNGFRVIEPGLRGSDVYEVQRYMKKKGYYPGWVDGIYGEGMKIYVLKFRKDHNLKNTHNIDQEFYNALSIELFE
ncbi:L,D-transpeptidase family protein [Marinisporobacter balticus]|uniref:Putative peptidoglycan binding protein n=1 Tax=Marinisporobacter balticus TaxID=2018667 RepID=A0A4V2SBR3_9FIRM|nr:L,D-transpeptidase family protein [Marinisporobacter balticus]TCO76510.1 putative peptidoglycan binding protein [Marinisporobacter balticus]